MNETAASVPPRVWIGSCRLVFRGVLPDLLDWHRHAFHCVLLSDERPFEVEDEEEGRHRCRALLVPGGRNHRLRFDGQRMLTMYVPPHDEHFASLTSASSTGGGLQIARWNGRWTEALDRWDAALDARLLRMTVQRTWGAPSRGLDPRVQQTVRKLAEGEGLDETPAGLAARVGLSGSRLAHLVKEHTGSPLGAVQRAYRFVDAARSMLAAPSFTRAAHAAGFADSAHFSRSFRAAYGMAPSRILDSGTRWAFHERL